MCKKLFVQYMKDKFKSLDSINRAFGLGLLEQPDQ